MRLSRIVAALAAVAVGAALLTVLAGRHGSGPHEPSAAPPAPDIVTGHRSAPRDPVSPRELVRARQAARRFLRGYLPYLYSRRARRRVTDATAAVRRSLARGRARVTPTQRRRHPRVAGLSLTAQARGTAVASARIDDGGGAYAITFTLSRHRGRWSVSDLGSD